MCNPSSEQPVEPKRIPDAEEVVWGTAIEPKAGVKIELLKSCHPPGAAAVEDLTGSRVVGIVADILDEQVARRP